MAAVSLVSMTMALVKEFDPEQPVVEAIRAGDRHVFADFVRRHDRWVRGVIFGVLGRTDPVDDVAQQVWTTVWRRLAEIRATDRWRPWLYALARNAALDAGRDVTRQRERAREVAFGSTTTVSRRDATLEADESYWAAMAAIAGLPELYREPFVLRHLSGWSYQEIAEVMGMPVDTVETRLVRARRLLRDALRKEAE